MAREQLERPRQLNTDGDLRRPYIREMFPSPMPCLQRAPFREYPQRLQAFRSATRAVRQSAVQERSRRRSCPSQLR